MHVKTLISISFNDYQFNKMPYIFVFLSRLGQTTNISYLLFSKEYNQLLKKKKKTEYNQ